jgi:WD40 repeat protein
MNSFHIRPSTARRQNRLVCWAAFALLLLEAGAGYTAVPDVIWASKQGTGTARRISTFAFSPDGTLLASGVEAGPPAVAVWRTAGGSLVTELGSATRAMSSLAFSSDNLALAITAIGGMNDHGTVLVRLETGIAVIIAPSGEHLGGTVAHPPIPAADITHNRPFVITGGDRAMQAILYRFDGYGITQLDPNTTMTDFASTNGGVTCITFAPDGATFAVGAKNGAAGRWLVSDYWDKLDDLPGQPDSEVSAIRFLLDGREVITVLTNLVGTTYPDTYKKKEVRLRRFSGDFCPHVFTTGRWVYDTALTHDGKYLFLVSDTGRWGTNPVNNARHYLSEITLWRVADGRRLLTYDQDLFEVKTLELSPDGRNFAYGGADGFVRLAWLPLLIEEVVLEGNHAVLRWTGGSGRYQLQCTANLAAGSWADVGGPTTATAATNAVTGTVFYRVQSLPNP